MNHHAALDLTIRTPDHEASDPGEPRKPFIAGWEIKQLLGEGGMGQVWRARRADISLDAAIKVVHPDFAENQDVLSRLRQEALALNIVRDAGIVTAFEFGTTEDGFPYLAMDLVEGQDLRTALGHTEPKRRLRAALLLFQQLARVMEKAHAAGIVHRDLKPANVMVVADAHAAGGQRVKVLDFGIARVLGGAAEAAPSVRVASTTLASPGARRRDSGVELTQIDPTIEASLAPTVRDSTPAVTFEGSGIVGTLLYMPPEALRPPFVVSASGDVHALGVMMFEALAGAHPRAGGVLPADLDPALFELVAAAMAEDRAARPTMGQIAARLASLLHDRPDFEAAFERWRRTRRATPSERQLHEWQQWAREAELSPERRAFLDTAAARLARKQRLQRIAAQAAAALFLVLLTISVHLLLRARDAEASERARADEVARLANDKGVAQAALGEKEKLLAGKQAEIGANRERIGDLADREVQLKQALDALGSEKSEERSKLETELGSTQFHLRTARDKQAALEADKQNLEADVANLKGQVGQMQGQIAQLERDKQREAEEHRQELARQKTAHDTALAAEQQRANQLETKLQAAEGRANDLEKKLGDTEAKLRDTEQQLAESQRKLGEAEQGRRDAEQKVAGMQAELARCQQPAP